ncbi:MAG TPA: MbnP family protein [Bacteroidia bacterium]|nr:MbnP family protein [Bacteroidia bacterium]
MKKQFQIAALLLFVISAGFASCKKDDDGTPPDNTPAGTGSLRVNVVPMFGDSLMELNTEAYVTTNNDTITFSRYKFYISNVVLTDDGGNTYSVPESYFLIDASNTASQTITLNDVPSEHYTSMSFLIGVDSTRNVSGAQTGALDPANGMFWTWSSGYIMAKMEGTSPQSSEQFHAVTYHIGGFSGANSGLRTVTIPLTTSANVSSTVSPLVTLKSDAREWFESPGTLSITTDAYTMMPGPLSVMIADNYSNMFTLVSVQN